jgi:hypothetical protein
LLEDKSVIDQPFQKWTKAPETPCVPQNGMTSREISPHPDVGESLSKVTNSSPIPLDRPRYDTPKWLGL